MTCVKPVLHGSSHFFLLIRFNFVQRCKSYIEDLGWNRLELCPSEMRSLCWWNENDGGLTRSCCSRNPQKRVKKVANRENCYNNFKHIDY